MFAMCASSFIGIHESIINYAGNRNPESITCTHEEISVAMANGYAKIEGKPVLVCVHGTVGTQHAAMAIYDAWCDRVPVYLVLGNTQDATERAGEVFWVHSAQDPAAIIRDMTKWDENPVIIASRCARTPAGMTLLVELAEALQAGIVDQHRRMNFPTRHPLNGGAANQADVVLALEGGDISNVSRQAHQRNAKVISIT